MYIHDLQTHLKRNRDFTGKRVKICVIIMSSDKMDMIMTMLLLGTPHINATRS